MTLLFSNQLPNEELHSMLGGNFRVGTEWFRNGPFSIRVDLYARISLQQRSIAWENIDEPTPFAGGVAVMGSWAVD